MTATLRSSTDEAAVSKDCPFKERTAATIAGQICLDKQEIEIINYGITQAQLILIFLSF